MNTPQALHTLGDARTCERIADALGLAQSDTDGRYAETDRERAAREYAELNTLLGLLTATRSLLKHTALLAPLEEPVPRHPNGAPMIQPSPRRQWQETERAIIDAEHALLRWRDRNGWSRDAETHALAAVRAVAIGHGIELGHETETDARAVADDFATGLGEIDAGGC